MSANKPLSEPQKRVMRWMSKRWSAEMAHTNAIHINGKRVCNIDTMTVLMKRGLIVKDTQWTWKATDAGLAWVEPTKSVNSNAMQAT